MDHSLTLQTIYRYSEIALGRILAYIDVPSNQFYQLCTSRYCENLKIHLTFLNDIFGKLIGHSTLER